METQSRECAGNEGPQGVIVTSPELCRGMEPPTPQTLVSPKCPPCRTAPRCPLSPPHHNRCLPGRDPAQPPASSSRRGRGKAPVPAPQQGSPVHPPLSLGRRRGPRPPHHLRPGRVTAIAALG